MNITQAELSSHPLMKQVTADIAEGRAKQRQEQLSNEMEAQRLRGEQGKFLKEQYDQAVQDYERLRQETHAAAGKVWACVQAYSRVTSQSPQGFVDHVFNAIHVPTLVPNPSPYAMSSSFTTTQAAVAAWFASLGRNWG